MSKHLQKLFALVLVCCAFLGSSTAWGQAQYEPFATTGSLTTMTGWSNNSGTAGQLQVVSGNLSYTGLPTSTGNMVAIKAAGSEDAKLALTQIVTSGSVYASFLIKPESGFLDNTTVGGYFFHFIGQPNNAFVSRLSIRNGSTANTFNIGVLNYSGGTPTGAQVFGATPTDYATGQTYLVVVKYDITAKSSSIWVNPVPGSEETAAAPKVTNDLNGLALTQITGVAIRQSNSSSLGTGNIDIDELRVGTTWASVTPSGAPTTTPVLTPSTGSINLGDKVLGATAKGSYTLSAENLPAGENVIITASGSFAISTSETETYTSTLTIPASELATAKTIYVQVTPTTAGELTGEITHSVTGATDAKVSLVVFGSSPFANDFTRCIDNLPGGWMQYSVAGAQTWACTTFGQQGSGVQMSGYSNSTNNPNQDWLISPKMDLTGHNIPLVGISYRTKFAGDALKIMVSTNYSGAGDPTAATWTELTSLPADEADIWRLLENLGLQNHKSAATYLAFVYTSTDQSAARWTLDNFELRNVENYLSTTHMTFNFSETAQGSTSAAQEFTFSAVGFTGDVVVTAPSNFQLSKDGTNYASSLTYTSAEAAASNKVYVRFAPASTSFISSGPVTFTSGETVITRGMLTGSSMLKANTLEVVTWNMEWFGATGTGPSDDELQYANAKKVITELNADIIGVQEVVDEAKVAQLAAETGYTYTSETMPWQDGADQKVGFLYKTETVKVKKEKVLLSKLYNDIKNNGVTLANYPDNRSDFLWSSGRLPYMVQFEATINGVKQTLHVVNLHAKANGDNNTFDYSRRLYDAKVLKDSLDAQYANVNLILLGDFNDDVDVSVVNAQKSSFDVFVADEANYKTLTYDLSVAGKYTYESGSFKSFLDHIFISSELTDEYVANSTAIEETLLNSIANFRTTTSDHLPVSARFILSADPVAPSTVSFTNASVSKTEDAGKFNVSLTLSEAVATEQTVTITPAASSTATAADYTITGATNGAVTVTIPANATTATFEVAITDDTETEAAEQVVFEISNPSSGLVLGTAKTYTLTIEANDTPTPATVTFTNASISKTEDAGSFNVSLTLSKAVATAQTVTIAPVAGGTASAADYTLTGATNNAITVTIPANATTATFGINITDDTDTEAVEQVVFEISNPSNMLVLGTAKTFTLTIEANDAPTGIADGTKGQFSVYPTLVNDSHVSLLLPERVAATAKVTMVVYSAEGRKVLTTTGTQSAVQGKLNSRIANLPAGIYMILIETGKEYFQTKMVKN